MNTKPKSHLPHRRNARVTWVGVAALLSVLIAPCTVALSAPSFLNNARSAVESDHQHTSDHHGVESGDHHSEQPAQVAIADTDSGCHGGHGDGGALEDDCCCDVTGLASSNSAELQQPTTMVVGIISNLDIVDFSTMYFQTPRLRGPPRKDTSPPVYRTTQRIRI